MKPVDEKKLKSVEKPVETEINLDEAKSLM